MAEKTIILSTKPVETQMFQKILVTTDMPDMKDPAVISAFKIAVHNRAKLTILHVLESAFREDRLRVKHFRTGKGIICDACYESEVRQVFLDTYARIIQAYDNVEVLVIPGIPWLQILEKSREIKADLIILGPHAGRAAQRGVIRVKGIIGSTAEGVIKHEPCPTLIVNQIVSANMVRLKKIMVGVDFSGSCRSAINFAVKIARNYHSKFFVFHMLGVPPSSRYSQADYEADARRLRQRLEEFCEEIPADVVREYCVYGGSHPYLAITGFAIKKNVDLIVMGSHTGGNGRRWYVGSSVEQVSHKAHCPVAVVTDSSVLLKF